MPPHKSYTLSEGIYLSPTAAEKLTDESLEWEERKPIGIRFNPTDRALCRILVDKAFGRTDNIVLRFFRYINVYELEPWSLSNFAHKFGEGKLYFFTPRKMKYGKGKIIDRKVRPYGYWQKTGPDSTIEIRDNSIEKLVTKTSLTFYKKDEKAPEGEKGEKTPWLMKEYILDLEKKSYENFVKSDDRDQLVLCVIYLNDGRKENRPQSLIKPFADLVNPENVHFPFSTSTQVNASSNPGTITLQKELPMCTEQNMEMESQGSGQNMEMESQGARYWSPFNLRESNPNPYRQMLFADHVNPNNYCPSPFSMSPLHEIFGNISNDQLYHSSNPGMIALQPELSILMSQVATDWGSLNTESVSGGSSDSCMINLPVQQAHFMDDQLPPDSRENSSSIVYSLSDKIKNNNLSDQNGSLNYSSMVPNGPLFSPFPNEIFMCDDNC